MSDLDCGQTAASQTTAFSTNDRESHQGLRALAVATATRSEVLPDIPTLREFVPGYVASQWYGIGAPRDAPVEVIARLNKEIDAVTADPAVKARFASLGVEPLSMTSADFATFIAAETEKWNKVIRAANIQLD